MKRFLELSLRFVARLLLAKYRPLVIGVTGSVGKTSTKDAIVTVLAATGIRVRGSYKNYNNELGVPLAIIGGATAGRSLVGWMRIFFRAKLLLLFRHRSYPAVLVLEMAADHPGDIRYLADFTAPQIGVVTAVSPAHTETLGSIDRVAREKGALVAAIPKQGVVILNGDDAAVSAMRDRAKGRVVTYGIGETNDVRAIEIQTNANVVDGRTQIDGILFKIAHKGSAVPVSVPHVVGMNVVYTALAAAAVGLEQGLHLVEIASALRGYMPPPGRLTIIDGIKQTTILDDTYNASPRATDVALDTLAALPRGADARTWAILGDMLELGNLAEEEHRKIGVHILERGIDLLVTVGEQSRDIGRGAREVGMVDDHIFHFATAEEAGRFVQDRLQRGDLLLIKGSQGMRLEKIVKELMAEPLRAGELLVRQDASWE